MMMSFNGSIAECGLKVIATSNIKCQDILSSLSLSDLGIYLADGPLSSGLGIVNLHPAKGMCWVAYINQNSCDSYGFSPKNLSKFNIKRSDNCFFLKVKYKVLQVKEALVVQPIVFIFFT